MSTTTKKGFRNDYGSGELFPSATANSLFDLADDITPLSHLAQSVAGSGTIDFSDAVAEYDVTSLEFTGVLTGNKTVTLPLEGGRAWLVYNNTSGAFTLTVKGASGTGVVVTQGKRMLVVTDGTNFYPALTNLAGIVTAAYTVTNVTTDRTYDANATTLDELSDIVGTLIADLRSAGLIQ